MLRRLRGTLGLGAVFAFGLTGFLLLEAVLRWFLTGSAPVRIMDAVITDAIPLGFLLGVAFAGIVALGGHRRTFEQITPLRFASWGATLGLAFGLFGTLVGSNPYMVEAIADVVILTASFGVVATGVRALAARGGSTRLRAAERHRALGLQRLPNKR